MYKIHAALRIIISDILRLSNTFINIICAKNTEKYFTIKKKTVTFYQQPAIIVVK